MALLDPNAEAQNRRSLVGMLLMVGFFVIWMQWLQSEQAKLLAEQKLREQAAATQPVEGDDPEPAAADEPEPLPALPQKVARDNSLQLENEQLRVRMTNRGAAAYMGWLKEFAPPGKPELRGAKTQEGWNPFLQTRQIEADPDDPRWAQATPEEAIDLRAEGPGALRVEFTRPLDSLLAKTNWVVVEQSADRIVFETSVAGGLRVRKTVSIDTGPWPGTESTGGHRLRCDVEVTNGGKETLTVDFSLYGLSGSISEGDPSREQMQRNPQVGYRRKGEEAVRVYEGITVDAVKKAAKTNPDGVERIEPADIDGDFGEFVWLAVGNHYFVGALAPSVETRPMVNGVRCVPVEDSLGFREALAEAEQGGQQADQAKLHDRATAEAAAAFDIEMRSLKVGESRTASFHFFLGPRVKKMVEPLGLTDVIRSLPICGVVPVGPFARALTWCLNRVYDLVGNYGWAIILLTIVIKVALMPVNRGNQISMAKYSEKMKRFQPMQKEIEARYKGKTDPASLQKKRTEQATAMREAGISMPIPPGCLLMLVQMPIFVGLFSALQNSIELRHQDWLWVHDLCAPDRLVQLPFTLPFFGEYFNLLPILMTLVWWLQSRLSMKLQQPTAMDDQQKMMQSMMAYMPIVFGVMFYNGPSGLVLYWTVSTLISVLEFKLFRKAREAAIEEAKTKIRAAPSSLDLKKPEGTGRPPAKKRPGKKKR